MRSLRSWCLLAAAVGVALEEVQLLKIEAADAQAPADEKPPLPAGLAVILTLCVQYFSVYVALQFTQSYKQLVHPGVKGQWEKILEEAVLTVDFAPMLGVLFLALRMRAQQLAPPNGNVPEYVQAWMWACSLAVLGSTLASILEPWLGGGAVADKGAYQSLARQGRKPSSGVGFVLQSFMGILRLVSVLFVYAGFTIVILGLFELPAPRGSEYCKTCKWRYSTPVAPAVECTINLCVQYFGVHLAVQLVKTYNSWMGLGRRTFLLRCLEHNGLPSVRLCPMLAIMFIGARMRALQMDLDSPPVWAQAAFFAATWASLAQTMCAIITPCAAGEGRAELNDDGEVLTTGARAGGAAHALSVVRYAAMTVLVGGVVVTGMSIFEMRAPYGETPAVSQTLRCVLILMTQFLTVALSSMIAQTYSSVFLGGVRTDVQKVLDACEPSLTFIPMMCVLFVGTRMRALQLDPEGAPQLWAQDGMEVCTWAILAQMLAAMATPFFTGELGGVHVESPVVAKCLVATRYVGLGANALGLGLVGYGMYSL